MSSTGRPGVQPGMHVQDDWERVSREETCAASCARVPLAHLEHVPPAWEKRRPGRLHAVTNKAFRCGRFPISDEPPESGWTGTAEPAR